MSLLKSFWLILSLLISGTMHAGTRDTVSVMVYNLLFYGHYTSFCTPHNNNTEAKDEHLRAIIGHTLPDIFGVNEMGPSPANANRILNNAMNSDGRTHYAHAGYTNVAGSNLVNMLFYDTEKFVLYDEDVVASVVRDINRYTLYYNDPELGQGNDTIFMHVFLTHMKAGSSVQDQQRRTQEANAVMNYIEAMNISGNAVFMGDFNMNSSFEEAYQIITYNTNDAIRFYDPIDRPGLWWNNPDMAPYHTQSPRTGQHDCFVTGGLDDRYDQILATKSVIEGYAGIKYLEGSYRAIGQDGQRFNQSLVSPPNHSEPQHVIQALYNMSDHLPVKMKMTILDYATTLDEAPEETAIKSAIYDSNTTSVSLYVGNFTGTANVQFFSISGSLVKSLTGLSLYPGASVKMDAAGLLPGTYIIRADTEKGIVFNEKIIIR